MRTGLLGSVLDLDVLDHVAGAQRADDVKALVNEVCEQTGRKPQLSTDAAYIAAERQALIDRFGVTPPAALAWCRQACVKPLRLHYSPYCVRRTTL